MSSFDFSLYGVIHIQYNRREDTSRLYSLVTRQANQTVSTYFFWSACVDAEIDGLASLNLDVDSTSNLLNAFA